MSGSIDLGRGSGRVLVFSDPHRALLEVALLGKAGSAAGGGSVTCFGAAPPGLAVAGQ